MACLVFKPLFHMVFIFQEFRTTAILSSSPSVTHPNMYAHVRVCAHTHAHPLSVLLHDEENRKMGQEKDLTELGKHPKNHHEEREKRIVLFGFGR